VVPPIHFFQAKHNSIQISPHAISGLFQPWKGSSKANFKVTNSLQHILEKWVGCCKKYIACQGGTLKKILSPHSMKFWLRVTRRVHELCKQPSYIVHLCETAWTLQLIFLRVNYFLKECWRYEMVEQILSVDILV
jgi:hypothetical protein